MSSQALMEKMEARQHYPNNWNTDLLGATAADPIFCFFSFWCGPCASYLIRKRALHNDLSRYTCCGGYMPCSGRCGESECPELCLCSEVFFCFNTSVASTRFMIQDEFNLQTTECDNCIIGFMFCLQQLACIFSLIACILGSEDIAEAADLLKCLADLVYCTVCPCMQTQHKVELDKRDEQHGITQVMAVPPTQQMSRMDQPIPPPVGYSSPPPSVPLPPPSAPGYPVSTYPPYPQPPEGYPPYPQPPQGYPPYPQSPEGHPPYPQPPQDHPPYPQPPQGYPPYPQSPQGHSPYPQPPQDHPPYPHSPEGHLPNPQPHEGHPPYPQPPQGYPPYSQPPQGYPPYPHLPPGYPPVSYPPPSGPYPPPPPK